MMENYQNSLAWRVGGPQGSGVDTAARIFANACLAGRLHVFGRREYYSNIMGRHSYYDVRVADRPMSCHRSQIGFLITFEEETLARQALRASGHGVGTLTVQEQASSACAESAKTTTWRSRAIIALSPHPAFGSHTINPLQIGT
jgi:Pyruvate/2-oxoacid:ferredoxin oxidoreductase gamma subunit